MESHNTNIRESLRTAQPPPQQRALKTKKFVMQEKNKKCVTFLMEGGGGLHKNVHMTFLVDKIDLQRFPKPLLNCT